VEFYVNKPDHSLPQGIEVKNGANLHIPYTLMVGTGTIFCLLYLSVAESADCRFLKNVYDSCS